MNENDVMNVQQFFADEQTLSLIVEAILAKIKSSSNALTSDAVEESVWNNIVTGLTKGLVNEASVAGKGVSTELLAEVIVKGKFLSYSLVMSADPIETAVSVPELNTIYLLKNPDAEDSNVSMWMRAIINDAEDWISLGGVKMPELKYVDVENPDSVNNIVAHVKRGEIDYEGSKNVQPDEIVTAQALTNVLVGLGYANKIVVPFERSQGKTISEVIGRPMMNTFYVYQQSADENDWACYTAAPIINGDVTKYVWLKISGAEGSAPVEVDLSNYWSKDELKPITAEQVTTIIERASTNVGL